MNAVDLGPVRGRAEHRDFLNRYYGVSRHFYDLTRKYYLLGRDRELNRLLRESWSTLVEVGPGTGRNLRYLNKRDPKRKLGGLEASEEMLRSAEIKCPFARIRVGFAEDFDLTAVHGTRPERILFSYCLSMVQDPEAALDNAMRHLAPGGEVVIVDFGDFGGLPSWFRGAMRHWLETFHVRPIDHCLARSGLAPEWGRGRYSLSARLRAPSKI